MKYKFKEVVKLLWDWENWDFWFPYPESAYLKKGFVAHKNGSFYAVGCHAVHIWGGKYVSLQYAPNPIAWLFVIAPLCIRLERKIKNKKHEH